MPRFLKATASFVLGAIFAAALPAQITFITDTVSYDTIRHGQTLTLDSEGPGRTVVQSLTIRYDGPDNTQAQVFPDGDDPSIGGSGTFRLERSSYSLQSLDPEETYEIRVRFTPNGAGPFRGTLTLPIRTTGRTNSYTFNLLGRAADYNLSFQLPGGNQTAVGDGGTILFDDTTVDASATATVIAANSGSGPGTLEAVSLAPGQVFELGGAGRLPATIEPGRDFRFQVRFTPTAAERYGGSVTLRFGSGSQTLRLAGRGAAAVYSYKLRNADGQTAAVAENGTIALGSTPVGEEIVSTLTVTNSGSEEGTIANISITGAGYSIPNRPLLPARLDVGESLAVEIQLIPAEAGTAAGQLRIGASTFDLTAEALGEMLSYTLTGADGPRQIEPRDPIVFPQTPIGDSSEMTLQISNSGNTGVTLSGVGVGAGAFSLKGLPALPASLDMEQTISVVIVFEPNRLGPQNAMLAVNTTTSPANFTLNGIGAEAPDLPAVSFSNSGGTVAAADFVPLGLSIAEAFPVDIEGVLRLTFDSTAFANDPSIQFSTGGRSVPFRIPEGQTAAMFPGNLTSNPFLTGTVAGAITASATFAIADGQVNITPDTAPEAVFTVVPAAPSLRNLTLGATGQGRFSVQVIGFATSRSVSRLEIAFSGASGANIATTNLTADVADAFTLYYAGNQSAAFGSLFLATVNFAVEEGNFEDLTAVTITAVNDLGQSNPVSLTLN